ncbi:MAG: hydroxyacid dehydrogenase [Syntrophothermus sp.]
MAERKKVLIPQPIHASGMAILEPDFEVRVGPDASLETLLREIEDADALLIRTAPVPREAILGAKKLKIIARHGVGVDNIDVRAATERKIPVAYTPNANMLSVAEHVLAMMAALAKLLPQYDKATRQGNFEIRNSYRAVDLDGKTLGIVGLGRIGSLLARKASLGFNMKILGFDPMLSAEKIAGMGVQPVESLDELLRQSDFVSLHVPLTPETKGLIGVRQLALMKPSAFLLNAARGGVVDEQALYDALKRNAISGAGLDVFQDEPVPVDNPLLSLDNIIVTPHSAALTAECVVRMATGAAQAISDALKGKRPEFIINPEVYR